MRRLFLFLLLSSAMLSKAQFGYYSNSGVLQALPSYKQAMAEYETLCQRCEKEIEHNERELTRQYVAFLDGYRDFPEPILRKRQNELQRLVDNSVKFRKELKVWLVQAKDSLLAPSREAVAVAVEKVSIACDLDYVVDTDILAYVYMNPDKAFNITRMLLDAALYPDKPVTELDGYDDYLNQFGLSKPAAPATGLKEAVVNEEAATDEVKVATDETAQQ